MENAYTDWLRDFEMAMKTVCSFHSFFIFFIFYSILFYILL